jgi:cysteine desulfurase/selenocysteine lyase
MPLDLSKIRADFPALNQDVYGKPLVYLDNGATAHKPQVVLDAVNQFMTYGNSNVHRGVHFLSQQATNLYESARKSAQRFLNAPSEDEVIFVEGTTMACNLVAQSFGRAFLKSGDEIILSTMEHHANIVPWQMVAEQTGARIRVIPIFQNGELDLEAYQNLLSDRTKIVAITHVSNVLGTINPVAEIIQFAHEYGAVVMVDGAQSAPHLPVDVQALDADFYCFSGHKTFAPTGIGILYGKRKWLDQMPPYMGGGNMINTVTFEKTTYNELPHKFEAGTPNIAGVIGLGVALEYLMEIGMSNIASYEHRLYEYANKRLETVEDMRILGSSPQKAAIFSFVVGTIHPYDLGSVLDKLGIAVRTGHHCTQPLHQFYGVSGTARASFTFYNTEDEVDYLVQSILKAQQLFR